MLYFRRMITIVTKYLLGYCSICLMLAVVFALLNYADSVLLKRTMAQSSIDMSITNRQPESPSVSRILEPLGKNLFYLSSVKYDTDLNANSSTNFEHGSTRQEFLTADIIVDKLGDPYGLAVN